MRTRRDILGPLHDLLSEAARHVRDAHVAAGSTPSIIVTEAHRHSLECWFFEAYRDNLPIDLRDLWEWLNRQLGELQSEPGPLAAAFEAYACAQSLVEGLLQLYSGVIAPTPPNQDAVVGSS